MRSHHIIIWSSKPLSSKMNLSRKRHSVRFEKRFNLCRDTFSLLIAFGGRNLQDRLFLIFFIVFIQSEVSRVSQQSHGVNQTGNYTLSLRTHLIAGLKWQLQILARSLKASWYPCYEKLIKNDKCGWLKSFVRIVCLSFNWKDFKHKSSFVW